MQEPRQSKGQVDRNTPRSATAYRATKRIPTGAIPFFLTYGTEAIIPVDVYMPIPRTKEVGRDQNVV